MDSDIFLAITASVITAVTMAFLTLRKINKVQSGNVQSDEVKCDTCKHKIDRADAQIVDCGSRMTMIYCPEHKKPYSRTEINWEPDEKTGYNAQRQAYYAELEVDEQGVPVGYKKK